MEGGTDLDYRSLLLDALATDMPLAYTCGTGALKSWSQQSPGEPLQLMSASARSVSFYLGPARRYFGDPKATLEDGRGRLALLINRLVIQEDWKFSPFDVGEVLYHWREGRLTNEFVTVPIFTSRPTYEFPCSILTDYFRTFLDEGYEKPLDYLNGWCPPRPSLKFEILQNTVYRAASDRWFGRVRPFAPAWTFEVRSGRVTEIPIDAIEAVVLIRDPRVNADVPRLERFLQQFGERTRTHVFERNITHPDLPTVILETETMGLIRDHLGRIYPNLEFWPGRPSGKPNLSLTGVPEQFTS